MKICGLSKKSRELIRIMLLICFLMVNGMVLSTPFITEFMAQNKSFLLDDFGESSDWIEIYNSGPGSFNIGGYYLTDNQDSLTKWRFPDGVIIPDGGYLIVFASGRNLTNAESQLHTNFRLNKNGGYLALVAPDCTTILQAFNSYPALEENISFGSGLALEEFKLINSNTVMMVFAPTNELAVFSWTGGEPFDDSNWNRGISTVGFDIGVVGYTPLTNKLDSTVFAFRYEMDVAPYSQDLDNNKTNDWSGINFPTISNGIAIGTNGMTCDANFDRSIWRSQFGTNFTAEFSVQVFTNGTEGAYGTLSFVASKGNNIAPWLNIRRYGQSWGTVSSLLLGKQDNTDRQHIFRIVREGANCWVWRDNVLINPAGNPLTPSTTIAAGNNALFIGDNSSTGNNGQWMIDYIRLQPGAYAPDMEDNLYGSLIKTDLRNELAGKTSFYVRIPFVMSDEYSGLNSLVIRIKYDDGFVAYLNGIEVARQNAPDILTWNSTALTNRNDIFALQDEIIDLSSAITNLISGTNILAIQMLTYSTNSKRCLLSAELNGFKSYYTNVLFSTPTPGSNNTTGVLPPLPATEFFPSSQFFHNTLTLTLSNTIPDAKIYYTIDGSIPDKSNGTLYDGQIIITNSTEIRARAYRPGYSQSEVKTKQYVKISPDLINFTSPLPILTIHNFGKGEIPGVSGRGPNGDGSDVVQVEHQSAGLLILDRNASNTTEFAELPSTAFRTGIRLRGSSAFNNTKKSYSLELWNDGENTDKKGSLLGMPPESDWVLYGPSWKSPTGSRDFDAALIHNSFIYELANLSGYYAPRTRFVEVFINTNGGAISMSNYAGLFILMEKIKVDKDRVDIPKLSDDGLTGGWMINVDRMDALPHGSTIGSIIPRHFHTAGPDGILQTPNDNPRGYKGKRYLFSGTVQTDSSGIDPANDDMPNYYHSFFNFESPKGWEITSAQRNAIENYVRAFDVALYSQNYRDPIVGYKSYIDVENWVHHYILQNFPKNQDAEVLSTYIVRESSSAKLKYGPIWDFDRSYNKNPTSSNPSANLDWVRDRLFYTRLFTDPDFYQAYIDKWQKLRMGALSDASLLAIVDRQTNEITAIVPAREGMTDFAQRIAAFKLWLTNRASAIDAQFLKMPLFNKQGGQITNGFTVILTNPNPAGVIYYTVDGSDPRSSGGAISQSAQSWQQAIVLNNTTIIKARVLNGTNWSGLADVIFFIQQDFNTLVLTELMYDPPAMGELSGDNFEFIELKNIGTNTLNLSGLTFTSGITFTFTNGTFLEPGDFFLLARNPDAMQLKYPGIIINGVYSGKLDNKGETVTLSAFDGTTIFSITYNNDLPWPVAAAGYGFSLVQVSPNEYQAPDRPDRWRASGQIGGSPGIDAPPPYVSPVFINEVLLSYSDASADFIELYNPNKEAVDISGWFITNDKLLRQKYRIPSNTVIPAMGYIHILNSNIASYANFTFSPFGDNIYLFSADVDGNLTGYTHGFAFNAIEPAISIGRIVNSIGEELFLPQKTLTPGQPNVGAKTGPIIINEIMYHPAVNGIEYIELANISSNTVPLFDAQNPTNRWKINGAGFVFPENVWLAPGGMLLVVATNPPDFRTAFAVDENVQIFGPFTGNLQNDGETLSIYKPVASDTNGAVYFNVIDEVRYNDMAPWPIAADGTGFSLHRINPNIFGSEPTNWVAAVSSPGVSLDIDNDGLPDVWEAAFGTDLTMPDDINDPDGDGVSNKNEYFAGSHPLDANSYLSLQAEPFFGNNHIIKFILYAGRSYYLEYTDSIGRRWDSIIFYEARITNRIEYFSHCTTNKSCFYRLTSTTPIK